MAELLFGTASFAYEGWKGLVYHERYREATFRVECLREYAQFAPFRTVEFDFTFYRPPTEVQLRRYASVLPAGFPVVSKVWEEITMPRFPNLERHGPRAGAENPRYLEARVFREEVLAVYERAFHDHTGPFVFEFQTDRDASPKRRSLFLRGLDRFLAEIPRGPRYSVEIRTPAYFVRDYFEILRRHGVAHVFNWWTRAPPLLEQLAAAAPLPAPFSVVRILVPPGMPYESAVEYFRPYDRVKAPREDMRRDLVTLIRSIAAAGSDDYVLVNNRAEGCAPLTIRALARELGIETPEPRRAPARSLFDL